MNAEEGQHRFARAAPRCVSCGYDHAGLTSARCPECGTPRTCCFTFADMGEFYRAIRAFGRRDLIVRSREPRAGLSGITGQDLAAGFLAAQGAIWLDLARADEIERVIDEQGLALSLEPRPIVDRAEPICPHCEAELDAQDESERCLTCGGAFSWIDIEQPDVALDDAHCRACGYDLRGLPGAVCPECGTRHEPDLEDVVRAASGNAIDRYMPIDLDARIRRNTITAALIVAALAFVLLIHLLQSMD